MQVLGYFKKKVLVMNAPVNFIALIKFLLHINYPTLFVVTEKGKLKNDYRFFLNDLLYMGL